MCMMVRNLVAHLARARARTHTHIPPLPYVAYQFVSTDLNFPSIKFLSEPCSVLN